MATIIASVVIFLLLVLIHEFGHFIVAKLCGVTVHEFAVGMGPVIFKKEYKGTVYSLRCVPIGGFCSLEGEDEESDDEGAFGNKSPLKRIAILLAGALMNIFLGFVLMTGFIFSQTDAMIAVPVIDSVQQQSAAESAGLLSGDKIVRINGEKIQTQSELKFELSRYKGGSIKIDYNRDGELKSVDLTPKQGEDGAYYIGFVAKAEPLTFKSKLYHSFWHTAFYGKAILVSLWDLVTGSIGVENMSGPVGITSAITQAASVGLDSLVFLFIVITVNLGVFNLLPVPALDGGRLLFFLIEFLRGKPIDPKYESYVHFAGLCVLLLIMLLVSVKDVISLIF